MMPTPLALSIHSNLWPELFEAVFSGKFILAASPWYRLSQRTMPPNAAGG
jgi:hypothetical protein